MKERIISPPLAEHASLREKLTPGEQIVFELFNRCLSPEWEIYIQPHLNGLRPDFVLLHPNAGIAVFEVKDWNLNAMRYFIKDEDLWAEKDGKEFCLQKENPIPKVKLYKEEIYNLYCPRIGSSVQDNGYLGWASITAGVIFPFADTNRVKELLHRFLSKGGDDDHCEQYNPISGKNEIDSNNICKIFPESTRKSSRLINESFAKDLRGWLVEPDFSSTQREPLRLDKKQNELATTRTDSGYRRIKGPAGSGKSIVLASRAVNLMRERKSLLIVTYNITLMHYLRDLAVRDMDKSISFQFIEFLNFHSWCKRVCCFAGREREYNSLFGEYNERIKKAKNSKEANEAKDDLFNKNIPSLTGHCIEQQSCTQYDAILVDEGQDYLPLWWNTLRKACKDGGEMVLVADATQDIYGSVKSWTDEVMEDAGFSGRWSELYVSYRLPPTALSMARDFAKQFLPAESAELPQPAEEELFDYFPCALRWVQCSPCELSKVCIDEIIRLMHVTGERGLANADITFLVEDLGIGFDTVEGLEKYNIHSINTFSKDERKRRCQKTAFYMGNARIKATTLHSFKGWEARLLVVCINHAFDPSSLALVYAGLTRLKRHAGGSWLTIVSSAKELESFGKTWPSYERIEDSFCPL